MSLSQFHCTSRLYLDMHGLIFETSICYWQDQPGRPPVRPGRTPRSPGPGAGRGQAAVPGEGLRRPVSRRRALRRPPFSRFRVAGSRACYRGCENRGPFRS